MWPGAKCNFVMRASRRDAHGVVSRASSVARLARARLTRSALLATAGGQRLRNRLSIAPAQSPARDLKHLAPAAVDAHGRELAAPGTAGVEAEQRRPIEQAERRPVAERNGRVGRSPAGRVEPGEAARWRVGEAVLGGEFERAVGGDEADSR